MIKEKNKNIAGTENGIIGDETINQESIFEEQSVEKTEKDAIQEIIQQIFDKVFPRPMVIYLYYTGEVPDEYTLTMEFDEGQGVYEYKVPVLKLPEISVQEFRRNF